MVLDNKLREIEERYNINKYTDNARNIFWTYAPFDISYLLFTIKRLTEENERLKEAVQVLPKATESTASPSEAGGRKIS